MFGVHTNGGQSGLVAVAAETAMEKGKSSRKEWTGLHEMA